jgi:hypothetical protein
MQVFFDHIAAVLLGGTVLLIIAVTQFQGQEAAVDGVQYYAAKSQMVDLVRQLQVDLQNVGAGVDNAQIPLGDAFVAYATSGDTTDVLAVRTYPDTTTFAPKTGVTVVCYQRVPTGETAYVRDPATAAYVPKPTFRVVRRINPTAPAACTGGIVSAQSMSSLTEFHVELRREDGSVVGALPAGDVRQLAVRVRAVSPLGGGTTAHLGGMKQHVEETRWERVVRPRNLARRPL